MEVLRNGLKKTLLSIFTWPSRSCLILSLSVFFFVACRDSSSLCRLIFYSISLPELLSRPYSYSHSIFYMLLVLCNRKSSLSFICNSLVWWTSMDTAYKESAVIMTTKCWVIKWFHLVSFSNLTPFLSPLLTLKETLIFFSPSLLLCSHSVVYYSHSHLQHEGEFV